MAFLPRRSLVLPFISLVVGCTSSTPDPSAPTDSGTVDTGTTDAPVADECPAPTGPGTKHAGNAIKADETWTAAGSPHVVTFGQQVTAGATLTIEPCAVVRVQAGYKLVFENGGKLVANGTAQKPIRFVADDPAKPWGALSVFAPSTLKLAYTTLENGGDEPSSVYGAIDVRGDQLLAVQELLSVDHVTIKGSANYGVSLRAGAGFTKDSHDLVVTGSKKAPIRLLPRLASNLPTGSYAGNGEDWFAVETEAYGNVTLEDVTFHDRGVPYRVGSASTSGELRVGGDKAAVTLTLEPGVVLQFVKNEAAGLFVDPGTSAVPAVGSLVAIGTAAKPIVFTSAETTKVAGAWRGLVFGNLPNAKNRLEHVRIEFAGGPSRANSFHCDPSGGGAFSKDEDAAFAVFGQPTAAFLKDSEIADSASLGVNLAYSGDAVDFLPTNTFTRIATCKQSTPRSKTGACPSTVPCP